MKRVIVWGPLVLEITLATPSSAPDPTLRELPSLQGHWQLCAFHVRLDNGGFCAKCGVGLEAGSSKT